MHSLRARTRGYIAAVVLTAIAIGFRQLLAGWLGHQAPFLLFVVPVIVSAHVGGAVPGLLATALGALTGSLLFVEPADGPRAEYLANAIHLGVFVVAGVLVSWLGDALRSAMERERLMEEAQEQRRRADEFANVAEHRTHEAEEKGGILDAIMEYIPEGITVADAPDVNIRMVSKFGQRLTGRPAETIEHIPADKHVVKWGLFRADGSTVATADELPLTRATCRGEIVQNEEWVIRRPDGSKISILCNAGPIRSKEGLVVGGLLAWRDITQLKQAEQALKRNEELLQAALAASRLFAWEWNLLDGSAVFSETVNEVLGISEAEDIKDASHALAFIHPEDRTGFDAAIQDAVERRDGYTLQLRAIRRDTQRVIWLEARGCPQYDGTGRVVSFTGTAIDITQRKQAEDALLRSEARFRICQEASLFGFTILRSIRDAENRIVDFEWEYVNPAAARILRHTPDELVGKRLLEFLPGNKSSSGLFDNYVRVVETGEPHDIELHYGSEGISGYFRNMAVKLEDGVAISFTDVSDRKRLEQGLRQQADELERQNQRLRLLWESAGVLLSTDNLDAMLGALFAQIAPHFDLDIYFAFMLNPAGDGLRLVSSAGLPGEEIKTTACLNFGQTVSGTVALQRQPIVASHIQQSDDSNVQLVKRLGVRAYACHPLMVGDRLLGTLSFASRTRDEFAPDEVEFLWTICHYVTSAYERIRLLNELKEADRRKDEFLATLAHELRNPLAPIRTGLDLLQIADHDPAVREQVRTTMDQQLGQMVRLIDDLLDVSRITRNKIELKRERVELRTVIEQAVGTSRPLVEASDHRLEVKMPSESLCLNADTVRLAQVFSNLLNNAVKFTSSGGNIWLTAEREGGDVLVRVKDSGIGISPDMISRIFDLFVQADSSLEKSQGGLGIGLTLVKRLVEMHGGSVTVQSPGEGKGTEFIVRLPLVLEAAQTYVPSSWDDHDLPTIHRRILVVDDNRPAARMLCDFLEALGHKVRMAHDGQEALTTAERTRPELILLDIGLPNLNGYEVAKRIREQPWGKEIVLAAQTGYGQEEDRLQAEQSGFDHHLVKPIDQNALLRLIAKLPSSVRAEG